MHFNVSVFGALAARQAVGAFKGLVLVHGSCYDALAALFATRKVPRWRFQRATEVLIHLSDRKHVRSATQMQSPTILSLLLLLLFAAQAMHDSQVHVLYASTRQCAAIHGHTI